MQTHEAHVTYLERRGHGEEAGRDGAADEAGGADAGEHPEGRRSPPLGYLVGLHATQRKSNPCIALHRIQVSSAIHGNTYIGEGSKS